MLSRKMGSESKSVFMSENGEEQEDGEDEE